MKSALTEKIENYVGVIYGYKLNSAFYCRIKRCGIADACAAPASDTGVAHKVVIVLFICEHAAAISIVIGIKLHLVYESANGIKYMLTVFLAILGENVFVEPGTPGVENYPVSETIIVDDLQYPVTYFVGNLLVFFGIFFQFHIQSNGRVILDEFHKITKNGNFRA